MLDASALWAIGGFLGGSAVTWLVARHYYMRAARERPEWAAQLVHDAVAEYESTHPNADPGDLVAIFEEQLKGRGVTIDGGTF